MTVLTDQGQDIAGRTLGLKRYMEDFSNFTDRGTADLALWDWYMVYAAAFGISDRVMRELAKAYPQGQRSGLAGCQRLQLVVLLELPPGMAGTATAIMVRSTTMLPGRWTRALAAQLRLTEARRLPADSPTLARS